MRLLLPPGLRLLLPITLSTAPALPARAQSDPPADVSTAVVRAVRIADALHIDGVLDEAPYRGVPPIDRFIQGEPDLGAPATERTEVWLFFDDRTLYVSARCWDSEPGRWIANEMRRDGNQLRRNDSFGVLLDTFFDRRNAFLFYVNPIGGLADELITDERTPNIDWNTVWEARTGVFDRGWTVEIAIPFASLRYREGPDQTWGVNLRRIIRRKNEYAYTALMPATSNPLTAIFRVSAATPLAGLQVPAGGPPLEIKPYATAGLFTDRRASPALTNDPDGDVGVDVRWGPSQDLTLELTVNTDFAQVEVDEEQVNLTRFSLLFPEKREFFLEGRGLFEFGGARGGETPVLFFSRRIGLEGPTTVPINAGGRLTARSGRYTIGLLNLQAGASEIAGTGATNFTVVRAKRDILRRSSIGVLLTSRSASVVSSGSNQAVGVDALFSFFQNLNINAYVARTRTPALDGDDASYRGQIDYAADRYGLQLDHLAVGDHFNPEVGFLRRDDFRRTFGQFRVSRRPGGAIRRISAVASLEYVASGAGRPETRDGRLQLDTELENSDRLIATFARTYDFLGEPFAISDDVSIPPGGYWYQDVNVSYAMGPQRRASVTAALRRGSFYSGTITGVDLSQGRLELSPRLSLEPSAAVNRIDLADGAFTTTLLRMRATFTFTPRMFFSGLVQFNSTADAVSSNLRLRWEYQPGSELFLVYTDERQTEDGPTPGLRNRALVIKANRLLRF